MSVRSKNCGIAGGGKLSFSGGGDMVFIPILRHLPPKNTNYLGETCEEACHEIEECHVKYLK
jgi:hypothetical protein